MTKVPISSRKITHKSTSWTRPFSAEFEDRFKVLWKLLERLVDSLRQKKKGGTPCRWRRRRVAIVISDQGEILGTGRGGGRHYCQISEMLKQKHLDPQIGRCRWTIIQNRWPTNSRIVRRIRYQCGNCFADMSPNSSSSSLPKMVALFDFEDAISLR